MKIAFGWIPPLIGLLGALWLPTHAISNESQDQPRVAKQHGAMSATSRRVLKKSCFDCHDSATEEGGVNLEGLPLKLDSVETAEMWQKVLGVMNSGEMPPEDAEPIDAKIKTDFLAELSKQLVVAREALSDSGGVITMRRLNRREYENTIESLLGVKISADSLPDDASSGGFDTTGASLFFSSDQFEQYVALARHAIGLAVDDGDRPQLQTVRTEVEVNQTKSIRKVASKLQRDWNRAERWKKSDGRPPTDFGFIDEARVEFETRNFKRFHPTYKAYLDHPASKNGVPLFNFFRGCTSPAITLPAESESRKFIIRARVAVLHDDVPEHRRFVEYGTTSAGNAGGEINVLGFHRVTGTMENPQVIEIAFSPARNDDRTFKIRERHINESEAAKRFFMTSLAKTKLGPPPALWIDWMEWEGPIIEEWPPESRTRIFPEKPEGQNQSEYARAIIKGFAKRAFRTKLPSEEFVDRLMGLFHSQIQMGVRPREAIKEPLSIVLASPGFLYLNEPNFGQERRQLSDQELAVRLSYFLWSSPPDDELQGLADSGKLNDQQTLKQQTDRMLCDQRADHFVSGFTHQWLHMDRLDFFQFNYQKYKQFDDSVKASVRYEVYESFKDAIREKRPIRELLKSDHVMVNNLLAGYYGIDGVQGEHFRRVKVPAGLPRGGVLGMAAILAMGSDGERSSPVERGAWILRCLLNDAPPPAPANVPQLSRIEGQALSARDLQKAHQEEPQCAQCHRTIDPLGFGLENFDAVGLWRKTEALASPTKRNRLAKKSFPIDASGTMPDGTAFGDFFEMRDRIAENSEAFARGFTENLIEYALGRPYGFTDRAMADRIMKLAGQEDYAVDEFIHGVIQSKRFKIK